MPEIGLLGAALVGAVAFGSGDMLGACATRRFAASDVVLLSQLSALAFLCLLAVEPAGAGLAPYDTITALAGGVAHAGALVLLYRGLSRGRVGIVAPLCAICSIVVPLLGDLALGRPVTGMQFGGIALCALAAVAITACVEREPGRPVWWSARLGILSGLAYGGADLLLASIPSGESGNVVLVARCASAAFALALVLLSRSWSGQAAAMGETLRVAGPGPVGGLAIGRPAVWCGGAVLAVAAGVFDVVGQVAYVHAAARGSMGVASAVTALFPAVTVLLAMIVFRERVTTPQLAGYAIAGAGVMVLAA